MPEQRPSLDEILESRKADVISTPKGDGLVKVERAAPSSWNKDTRSAKFTMSSQAPDRYGDIVVSAGVILENFVKNPVALLFHNSRDWPIGKWSDVAPVESGRPPRVEGTLNFLPADGPVPEVDQAAWMVENGGINACSIGFIPTDDYDLIRDGEGVWEGGIRYNAWELVECSLVPVPAHPKALVKMASGNGRLAVEMLEYVLDTYAKNAKGLIVPREEYERERTETLQREAEALRREVGTTVETAVVKAFRENPDIRERIANVAPEVETETREEQVSTVSPERAAEAKAKAAQTLARIREKGLVA